MLRLRITEKTGAPVHAVALRCQIRIEPQRRRYDHDEEERLVELFGEPPQWGDSLRPFLWTHVATTVTGFDGATEIDLPVTCTYDFEVAGTKFFHSLDDGEIPLRAAVLRHHVRARRRRARRSHRSRGTRRRRSGFRSACGAT